jgi:lambda family phage portal protein
VANKPSIRQRIAKWIAGGTPRTGARLYASARNTRRTMGFGSGGNSSADSELHASLTQLRARSRQMVRDNPYAKRARTVVVNNVIGQGVGMQAQVMTTRGELSAAVNDAIEWAWYEWSRGDHCHMGGTLHFADLERAAMGQVFEAGEVLIRKHPVSRGGSRIPLSLEIIEAERLAGELAEPGPLAPGNQVRMGVEVDRFYRPVAYWIREWHPGDLRYGSLSQDRYERVPADQVFHLKLSDRWPQTRGEPWLHTVLTKLDAMNEYSQAEVQAARDSSFYFATVKRTPDPDGVQNIGDSSPSQPSSYSLESGVIQELDPDEELTFHTPNRPNTAMDPFLRYMLREVAAGCGVSYESLSRDYSQSNYSSSRLALLDDRDHWRVLQQWWIRSFREPLYREWLGLAIMTRSIPQVPIEAYATDMQRYQRAVFKPRRWSWIDPAKEQQAYADAVRNGFMTLTDVIGDTEGGRDFEEYLQIRKRELELLEDAGVRVETTVEEPPEPAAPAPPEPDDEEEPQDDPQQRVVSFRR